MEGVRTIANDDIHIAIVDTVSAELQDLLRADLSAYCYGATRIIEDTNFYSYEKTVLQFLERFRSKSATVRMGMAGELLVHALIGQTAFSITSASVFFNKEERHIKKGFDLTFFAENATRAWYGEVKSGEKSAGSADEKARALLSAASTDLWSKLQPGAPRSRWESALLDADLTLASADAGSMKKLLRSEATLSEDGETFKINAVLAGVVFHTSSCCEITEAGALATATSIIGAARFEQVKIVVAQQQLITDIIDFLESELNSHA